MKIIGVDCATDDAKVGVALGSLVGQGVQVDEALLCSCDRSVAVVIAGWLGDCSESALLAIDAPLGWPKPLAEALINHRAGETVPTDANAMFRRETDRSIKARLGKTPLDVGADRIARTAHAALRLLGCVQRQLGATISLAWSPSDATRLAAIEVYPAATLVAYRIRSTGYKKAAQVAERAEIVEALRRRMAVGPRVRDLTASGDLVDAVVCVLTGADFLLGRTTGPENQPLAEREGWIWAPRREA